MNHKQALIKLRRLIPNETLSIDVSYWYHHSTKQEIKTYTIYRANTKPHHFYGSSWPECFAQLEKEIAVLKKST